jgi:hypothetical protein
MENAVKTVGTFIVTRTRLIGTRIFMYTAYEAYAGHLTFMHIADVQLGRVASREISREMDQLPAYSEERSTAVRSFFARNKHVAYGAIIEAFPEAWNGTQEDGDISRQESV